MPIIDAAGWELCQRNNEDPYGKACVDVARRVMEILDVEKSDAIDAHALIVRADHDVGAGGITGHMAGAVAAIVSGCHSRGQEFKVAWNAIWSSEPHEGTINPALVTVDDTELSK